MVDALDAAPNLLFDQCEFALLLADTRELFFEDVAHEVDVAALEKRCDALDGDVERAQVFDRVQTFELR